MLQRVFIKNGNIISIEDSLNYIEYIVKNNESTVIFGNKKMITQKSSHGLPLFFWKIVLDNLGFNTSWLCVEISGYEHLNIRKFQYALYVEYPQNYKN